MRWAGVRLPGPVTAAAVVLDPANIPEGLNDSKRLTAARRAALNDALMACADVSIAHASVAEIDDLNILPRLASGDGTRCGRAAAKAGPGVD